MTQATRGRRALRRSLLQSGDLAYNLTDVREVEHPGRLPVTRDHRRQWRRCLYVYPVISRRSKGLSIGVNLNPDKQCNFSCLYCQISRQIIRDLREVDLTTLKRELKLALLEATSGSLWAERRFAETPAHLRRINDIAFSGDGEPTCLANFDEAVRIAAAAKKQLGRDDIKVVVITNASQFDRPQFKRALPVLDANNGEIWAKLDAGTEEFFRYVNRPYPVITLRHVLENIRSVARGRPLVVQSLFFRLDGQGPPQPEIEAYIANLREIVAGGGKVKLIQIHTIARPPASPSASALPDKELDAVAEKVRTALGGVKVEVYHGADVPPQDLGEGPPETSA
ncbi:MAG: radical SAM protein [Planctomycetota bacterium]|jgi:wyosine [tRNA(Phe)-imidazoG37] synthetase (radical SAM superfamily)